jgi:hypothetical protein
MKTYYFAFKIILVLSMSSFTGCMSYTTLQSPKTLEPAQLIVGAGLSKPLEEGSKGFMYEFNSRVGILNRFDIGAKFVAGSLYFLDGKYQILKEPISLSADLGWSYFSYFGSIGNSTGKTTCWYPMIIAGQDHWYVAVKKVHMSTEGEFELFTTWKISGSGWISTNIVAGVILGETIRFIPEVNFIIPDNGNKSLIVPAIGLQFVF